MTIYFSDYLPFYWLDWNACKHSSLANRKEDSLRDIYKKKPKKHTVIQSYSLTVIVIQSQRYISRQADTQPHIHTITETYNYRDRHAVTATDNHGDRHTFSKTDKYSHRDRQSRRHAFSETDIYSHRD